MESMIERVAKGQSDFDGRPWLSMSKADRVRYLERAKIAIEAMREPTGEMLDAVYNYGGDYISRGAWMASIDEALKEE